MGRTDPPSKTSQTLAPGREGWVTLKIAMKITPQKIRRLQHRTISLPVYFPFHFPIPFDCFWCSHDSFLTAFQFSFGFAFITFALLPHLLYPAISFFNEWNMMKQAPGSNRGALDTKSSTTTVTCRWEFHQEESKMKKIQSVRGGKKTEKHSAPRNYFGELRPTHRPREGVSSQKKKH